MINQKLNWVKEFEFESRDEEEEWHANKKVREKEFESRDKEEEEQCLFVYIPSNNIHRLQFYLKSTSSNMA